MSAKLCNCPWVDRWHDDGLFCSWCGGSRAIVPPPMLPAPPKQLALPERAGMNRERARRDPAYFIAAAGMKVRESPGGLMMIDDLLDPGKDWDAEWARRNLAWSMQVPSRALVWTGPFHEGDDLMTILTGAAVPSLATMFGGLSPGVKYDLTIGWPYFDSRMRPRRDLARDRHLASCARRRERRAARRRRRHPIVAPPYGDLGIQLRECETQLRSVGEALEEFNRKLQAWAIAAAGVRPIRIVWPTW